MDTLFLNSAADTVVALADGADGNWNRFIKLAQNYGAGMIPNAATQVNRLFLDTSVRELDDYMSKLKYRVPGLSADQPPKVGFLGEEQNHTFGVLTTAPSGHPVYTAFQYLGMDIPQPPKVINGHELTMVERAMFRIYKADPGKAWGPGMPTMADAYTQEMRQFRYTTGTKQEQREILTKVSNEYNKVAAEVIKQNNPRLNRPVQ